jgi:hypothetical protein
VADELNELFADLRADTIAQIRPPGAAQAHTTVRGRRRRTIVVTALSLALVVAGGTAVFASVRRPALVQAAQLATVARQTVDATAGSAEVVSDSGVVRSTYSRPHSTVFGQLTLRVACAGPGAITFVVTGTQSSEGGGGTNELTRLPVACANPPVMGRTDFVVEGLDHFTVELTDVGTAVQKAGFAYRISTDLRTAIPETDYTADPETALHLPDPLPNGSGPGGVGSAPPGRTSDDGWTQLGGTVKLAIACAGNGKLQIDVAWRSPTGSTVGSKSVEAACVYPPVRHDVAIGHMDGRLVQVRYRYESASRAPAHWAVQFLPAD